MATPSSGVFRDRRHAARDRDTLLRALTPVTILAPIALAEETPWIIDGAHAEATELLTEHRKQLDGRTNALLEASERRGP